MNKCVRCNREVSDSEVDCVIGSVDYTGNSLVHMTRAVLNKPSFIQQVICKACRASGR